MAKLSKIRAMENADVRRIRMRYNKALAAGFSPAEAAVYANGSDELEAKPPVQRVVEDNSGPTKARDVTLQIPKKISEPLPKVEQPNKPQPPAKTNSKVPSDWQDLPWPKLKVLAESVSGAEVKSRKHANEIIENAIG